MNRSRAVLVLAVLLVVGAGLAVTFFLSRNPGEEGLAAVLRAPAAGEAGGPALGELRGDTSRSPAELLPGELPPPTPPETGTAAAVAGPVRTLRGRVRMADGSPLPGGLALHAQRRRPQPRLSTLRDAISDSGDDDLPELSRPVVLPPPPDTAGTPPAGGAAEGASALAPATAAKSMAKSASWSGVEERTRTLVAADGRFEMQGVPEDAAWLAVEDELLYVDPAVRALPGQQDLELLLVRGASLSGRIADAAGAGIADASLGLGTPFDPFSVFDTSARMVELDAEGGDDGRYQVHQVPAGLKLIAVASTDKGNWQLARADVAPLHAGERRVLDFVLPPGNVVTGRVLRADGSALAAATVHLSRLDLSMPSMQEMAAGRAQRDRVRTDGDGRFRFEAVTDGEYELVLGQPGWRQVRSGKLVLKGAAPVDEVVLNAEPGLTIAGRVLDDAGAPVADASVQGSKPTSFADMAANRDRQYRERVQTGADGAFSIGGFDAGRLQLRVSAKGYSSARQDVEAGDEHIVVTLGRLASVSGIVVSLADGEPVQDFRVSLVPEGGLFDLTDMDRMEERMESVKASRTFRGREDGTFTLENVQPGSYDLSVTSAGFGATVLAALEVERTGCRGLVVMLPPEAQLTGVVVSARDGLPVEGATVTTAKRGIMSVMTESLVGSGPEAVTDAEGRFELAGLTGNTAVNLTVRHERFRELPVPELVLAPGEARDLGRLALSAGAAVHGRVLDDHGRAVPDTVVMASSANGSSIKRDSTDEEGRYRIEGLAPGGYSVMRMDFSMNLSGGNPMGMMKDMVFRTVTLAEDEDKEVDLAAKGAGGTRLSGKVSASDGAVPGAMLTLLPEQGGVAGMQFAGCDKDGRYEFTGVEPARYVLQVTVLDEGSGPAAGQATSPVSEQVVVGGQPEQRHDVLLPGGELHGTVENELDGKLVAGVRVVLERTDEGRPAFGLVAATNGRVGECYTNAGGAFRFRYLPGGTYSVVAGGQNLIGMGEKGWAQARVSGLAVASSGPGFGVRIKVRPAGAIEGTVRTTAGAPLAGVGVWVADGNGVWQSTLSEVSSDEGGAYSVGSLQEGAWTVAFRDGSHALKLVPGVLVHEGDITRLDVALEPGIALQLLTGGHAPGSLQITLIGPDGPVPTGLVSMNEVMSFTDLGSALNLGTFAPGAYHLTVMSAGEKLLSTTVTLAGSKPQTVAIEP